MNKLLVLLIICFLNYCPPSTENVEATKINNQLPTYKDNAMTFFLVRHAEKRKDQENPSLTSEGKERANNLASVLKDVKLDAIYSSNYNRTTETAQPIAANKNLDISYYNPSDLETTSKEIIDKYPNGKVLIVGHSNTTPNFVNLLAGSEAAKEISEDEYDNLYIVTFYSIGDAEVLQLRF